MSGKTQRMIKEVTQYALDHNKANVLVACVNDAACIRAQQQLSGSLLLFGVACSQQDRGSGNKTITLENGSVIHCLDNLL